MRFVVYGAGAVGGVLGGRLAQHGHDVVLIARGAHHDAIRDRGLRVESPDGSVTLSIPVVDNPAALDRGTEDVVLLCMKSQDTEPALVALEAMASPELPVVCVQNGVANERAALRIFANVYGVCVMCPAVHEEPGVVEVNVSPISGILDIGRYPHGVDTLASTLARAFGASTFTAEPRPDIMRWKYAKLLNNLGNAIDALCGPDGRGSELSQRARAEGEACLDAARIARASREEDSARRGNLLQWGGSASRSRPGSSSWQSLARGLGSIEADYLNGEIVLLGRLHEVPTPVNEVLRRLANEAARERWAPGSLDPEAVIRMVPGSE
jgi:2-dehydropantoate 2-reductase